MKISHIEHLGIAVKSIEEALPYYEKVLWALPLRASKKPFRIMKKFSD